MSLHAVGLAVGLIGLTMVIISFGMVTRPPTWDVRQWKPIWKQRGDFKRPGFEMFVVGMSLAAVGSILRLL